MKAINNNFHWMYFSLSWPVKQVMREICLKFLIVWDDKLEGIARRLWFLLVGMTESLFLTVCARGIFNVFLTVGTRGILTLSLESNYFHWLICSKEGVIFPFSSKMKYPSSWPGRSVEYRRIILNFIFVANGGCWGRGGWGAQKWWQIGWEG